MFNRNRTNTNASPFPSSRQGNDNNNRNQNVQIHREEIDNGDLPTPSYNPTRPSRHNELQREISRIQQNPRSSLVTTSPSSRQLPHRDGGLSSPSQPPNLPLPPNPQSRFTRGVRNSREWQSRPRPDRSSTIGGDSIVNNESSTTNVSLDDIENEFEFGRGTNYVTPQTPGPIRSIENPVPVSRTSAQENWNGNRITEPKKILFIMNEEHGRATPFLAVISEILQQNKYEVHVLSWSLLEGQLPPIETQAAQIAVSQGNLENVEDRIKIVFHELPDVGFARSMGDEELQQYVRGFGLEERTRVYKRLGSHLCHDFINYMGTMRFITRQIVSLNPDGIVIDSTLPQAMDACERSHRNDILVLDPRPLKNIVVGKGTLRNVLGRYPASSTNFRYPVPWKHYLENNRCWRLWSRTLDTSEQIRSLDRIRQRYGLRDSIAKRKARKKGWKYLSAYCPETDFPVGKIPKNIICCGPLVLPAGPGSNIHEELQGWLRQRRTILIHFGPSSFTQPEFVANLASAVSRVLESCPDVQFLWQLPYAGRYSCIRRYIQHEIGYRVRVFHCLEATPIEFFRDGAIACVVHHGGPNSFNEAVIFGIPQVIIPLRPEGMENAARVEYLGIGMHANKVDYPTAPYEVSEAIIRTISDTATLSKHKIRDRASALALTVSKYEGRVKAAAVIIDMVERKSQTPSPLAGRKGRGRYFGFLGSG